MVCTIGPAKPYAASMVVLFAMSMHFCMRKTLLSRFPAGSARSPTQVQPVCRLIGARVRANRRKTALFRCGQFTSRVPPFCGGRLVDGIIPPVPTHENPPPDLPAVAPARRDPRAGVRPGRHSLDACRAAQPARHSRDGTRGRGRAFCCAATTLPDASRARRRAKRDGLPAMSTPPSPWKRPQR